MTQWQAIPQLALLKIFDYLDPTARFAASSTCSQWRSCLFRKRYFENFPFHINVANDAQLSFFRLRISGVAKEIVIEFDFRNVAHIQKMRRLLYKVARCDNIRGLRFKTHNVGLVAVGDVHNEQQIDIEQCFVEPLKLFLSRRQMPCQLLDLGAIEALTYYGLDFLKALGKPQELQELTLASIKYDPSHYPILAMDTTLLQKCAGLQVLSLDYDTLSDELLHTIQVLPLRKLLIAVHGLDGEHDGVSEQAWANFAWHFRGIEVILTLVYALEAIEQLQFRILRRNMPLTHVRMLFCDYMNLDALEWMSVHNSETLRSIYYVDSTSNHSSRTHMRDMTRSIGRDPFVMMTWRCAQLREIVVHGYIMDPHNVVGMARLRGRQLERLEVSLVDMSGWNEQGFKEEISTQLGRQWSPIDLDDLHPALGCDLFFEEKRDKFVYELMRQDLSN
ncbi:F-box only protein 39 [Scaptodrosophila lebanonensis]|uniref:F-box only protein 39 n=1 Tax=Drosophila lebanonensis TaxID=7225 RepID=A0A6J2UDV1_DROLE|nr:F-box only protein 39 [Scaptodrosophila lebanonensis]